jgi:hypothetical protein
MPPKSIHVELLLDKEVWDTEGRRAGRIEEVRAKREGSEITVEAYHLGPSALLERLAAPVARMRFLRIFGLHKHTHGRRARWDQMDLSNPHRPVLRCKMEELAKLVR